MRATTLMLGIEEAISKTNGDGLDTGLPQNPDRIAHRGLVERGFARQKGATTQLHRARVLEVRIQSPPAENPQTIGSSAAEPIAPRNEGSWRDLTITLISAGSYLEDWFCFAGEVTVTLVRMPSSRCTKASLSRLRARRAQPSPRFSTFCSVPPHSMNSSAWASSNGGTVRPRAQQRDLVFRRHPQPRRR